MKKQITLAIFIAPVIGTFFVIKSQLDIKPVIQNQPDVKTEQFSEDNLRIVSTNPDPLEGATILPTQNIEFKFNKIMSVSEFKHRFDPELEHDVEATYDNKNKTTTMKITFKKPLKLGSGYTLFILSNTHSVDNKELGREYDYHFTTIKYKGV